MMVGIQIIKNSIKRKLYDYKTLIMISLFPLVLTTIFINVFSRTETGNIGKISLGVVSESKEIETAYRGMLEELNHTGKMSIDYEVLENRLSGEEVIKEQKVDFVIYITQEPLGIEVVKGKGSNVESMQIKGICEEFIRQIALVQVVGKDIVPMELSWKETPIKTSGEVSLSAGMLITMIIFGTLLGGQYGINQMFYIKEARGKRVTMAPVRKGELYIYEIIASWSLLFVITIGLVGVYESLFKVGLNNNIGALVIIVSTLTLMSITMGVIVGIVAPSMAAGENILSIIVIALNFTTGGFTPGIDLGIIEEISPVRGVVEVFNSIVLTGEATGLGKVVATTLIICIVLLVIAGMYLNVGGGMKREKYIKINQA